jgi:hypothetical protein
MACRLVFVFVLNLDYYSWQRIELRNLGISNKKVSNHDRDRVGLDMFCRRLQLDQGMPLHLSLVSNLATKPDFVIGIELDYWLHILIFVYFIYEIILTSIYIIPITCGGWAKFSILEIFG